MNGIGHVSGLLCCDRRAGTLGNESPDEIIAVAVARNDIGGGATSRIGRIQIAVFLAKRSEKPPKVADTHALVCVQETKVVPMDAGIRRRLPLQEAADPIVIPDLVNDLYLVAASRHGGSVAPEDMLRARILTISRHTSAAPP